MTSSTTATSKLRSIRTRLLILVLLPLLLMASVLVALLYFWTTDVGYRHLLMKVSTDLAVANESFHNTQENYLTELALLAQSREFRKFYLASKALEHSKVISSSALAGQLQKMQLNSGLDFIQLLDPSGCQLLNLASCEFHQSPLLQQALIGRAVSGVEVFSAAHLNYLSPELAQRAKLQLADTERAIPVQRKSEERGMLLHLVYPLTDEQGRVQALLSAGVLMNGNATFVDHIKETVYGAGSLDFDSVGTVTIFLQDVRISTNVPAVQKPGARALGTRVSEQVRQKVLVQGERWLDRAFVVSDWYISGYLPIVDVYGERVGMIYAGFLEAPFKSQFYRWMWQLLVIFAVIVLVCALLVVRGAKGIFKPIEGMVTVISQIRRGQRQRIDIPVNTSSELLTLGVEFNLMLDQLERQHDHIQESAEQLEIKINQRTKSLNQHIKLLQRTREQLVAKEKLAAIGELTAGIAHEINNPTTVILGYLDLLVAELGEAGDKVSEEVALIVQQVDRIRSIINDLLQFSRPYDYSSPVLKIDINAVVKSTQVLIKHDLQQKNIRLVLDLRASCEVYCNRQQMLQVLINLIVNAVAAINSDGRITIRSRNWRQQGVILSIRDNGCGMSEQIVSRIFDPFFSKTPGGTGLGLSVSYSILQGMQAEIAVRSRPGSGTVFFIWLPNSLPVAKAASQTDPFQQYLTGSV
ncbi:MAG: cache domain-containing protein [Pseudomonadales bacterium]|nr:cache domain-containing protein [Pseudomonadales bacterium]NRA18321.1 cache domain-containing protein [Oceanospirillaceae bacterium]